MITFRASGLEAPVPEVAKADPVPTNETPPEEKDVRSESETEDSAATATPKPTATKTAKAKPPARKKR